MGLLLEECRAADSTLVFVSHDERLASRFDTRLSLSDEVADALDHRLGQRITLSHGSGAIPGAEHADKPFTVVGILARTGAPVDRTVHISLEAMEAIHLDGVAGVPMPGLKIAPQDARKFDPRPKVLAGPNGRRAGSPSCVPSALRRGTSC